jgi:maltoporin
VGAATILLLDRPRTIGSLKATWWLNGRDARSGVKIALYGEGHGLSEGVRQDTQSGQFQLMPADWGLVAGAEVSFYTGQRNTFLNLFFRYGQGLGAYGDLAVPQTQVVGETSAAARDVVLAVSGNWEREWFGIMAAAYIRYFHDADTSLYGLNQRWEGTIVARPTVWFGQYAGLQVEASYQALTFNMIDPVTGTGPRMGSEWRFGVIPFISPAGVGGYTRPHLRVVYAVTARDAGARALYAPDDLFAQHDVEHYLGVQAEWWFNSSYR